MNLLASDATPTWCVYCRRLSQIVWRVSFVATRAAMPYGIMALAVVYALPGVVVLAALGANVHWISLVMKRRRLLGSSEAAAAVSITPLRTSLDPRSVRHAVRAGRRAGSTVRGGLRMIPVLDRHRMLELRAGDRCACSRRTEFRPQ